MRPRETVTLSKAGPGVHGVGSPGAIFTRFFREGCCLPVGRRFAGWMDLQYPVGIPPLPGKVFRHEEFDAKIEKIYSFPAENPFKRL